MSVINNSTDEKYVYPNDMNKLINIYMNQKKSSYKEIPLNQLSEQYVSPFHFQISEPIILNYELEIAEKIIEILLQADNVSCVILQQSGKSKHNYRIIYPEILLTYQNEQKMLNTIKQFTDKIVEDTDTVLPNSGKYKCIGMYNHNNIIENDFLWLCSLNGINFDQTLGCITYRITKNETPFKQLSMNGL